MQALQGSSQRQSVQQLQRQYPRPLLQWCGARSRNCKLRCKCARQDLYAVLGVAYDADASAIKAAFRARAKKQHPDVNKAADAEAAFRLLKRAHEVLSDSMLRAAYDADLQDQLPEAAAALRARDPRFARFERWRREIMPDLNMQLDVWTQEVMQLLQSAESVLVLQEQEFCSFMVQAAPPAATAALIDWQSSSTSAGSSRPGVDNIVSRMRGTLSEAVANVQRLHDKRYEQMQTRFPAYPDIVWYDRWLEVSDDWLDASEKLMRKWQPKIAAAAQWLPAQVK